jgi:sugar transferase EpsL
LVRGHGVTIVRRVKASQQSAPTTWRATPLERWGKRALDVSVSALGLCALSPVLLAITAAELKVHGWPPVFEQHRAGHRGRPFTIYKFRTMTDERGPDGALLPDAARLTRLGQWLRETSLDELPELLNVIKGDMSLVGPRPLLLRYLERYTPEQARRHDAPVGLTGWAQIKGRNALSWDEKFALDLWYVDHFSLKLDLVILLRTAWSVFRRRDISAEGAATMPEFVNSKPEVGRSVK